MNRRARCACAFLLCGVLALVVWAWAGTAHAAPITFNTALPVAKGQFIFRELTVFSRSTDDPDPADREMDMWAAVSVLAYGVNPDLALFGVIPYVENRLELTSGGVRHTRSARGIGDAEFFARYTLFQKNWPGGNFRIAPFAGLKIPTGDDDETDRLGRLPPSVQAGSGSLDPFGGIIFTYQTLDFQIDGQAAYRAKTEANDFESGDVARLDTSFQYRLWPRVLGGGVPGFLYGVLEASLVHQQKNEANGVKDRNSGGTQLFLTPGLQYVTRRWVIEAGVQVPVVQDLNGTALENDFTVHVSFRITY